MSDNGKNPDRMKMALIPVLGLVLLYVVAGGEEDSPIVAELAPAADSGEAVPAVVPAKKKLKASWPSESLQLIASHNPFELNDPRVVVDNVFRDNGLLTDPVMTEVAADAFYAELQTPKQQDDKFLYELWDELLAKTADNHSTTDGSPIESNQVASSSVTSEATVVSTAEQARQAEQTARRLKAKQKFDQLQQRLAALQTQRVTMIMESRQGKSALLGGRHIAEGELVEAGIRVASISGQGITFQIESPTQIVE